MHRYLAQRLAAGGNGADGVAVEPGVRAAGQVNGRIRRIDRAVAPRRLLDRLVAEAHADRGRGHRTRAADRVQVLELVVRGRFVRVADDLNQVFVENLLLLVGQRDEVLVHLVQFLFVQFVAQDLQPVAQRSASRARRQHDLGIV